ncbi:MAG: M23 family metallopeptidase [Candidatus Margulisiibacteriota bacterium]
MENSKKEFYTFILVPHSPEQRTFVIKVPRRLAKFFVSSAVTACVVLVSLFVYSSYMARRVVSYEDIKSKMLVQDQLIRKFDDQTRLLSKEITNLSDKEWQIRKMLGLNTDTNELRLSSGKDTKTGEDLDRKIDLINNNIKERQNSLERLLSFAGEFRKRFASMPSVWPSYGRIMSTFGYRASPWRGFHSGIDISGAFGSPIRATANGVVSFAGWRTGYGKAVMIDHGFGYQTLYGHTSRFAVSMGQRIRKGQVIAYIGMTGFSTGPHVHYEILRNGSCINPINYLNLNLAESLERRL